MNFKNPILVVIGIHIADNVDMPPPIVHEKRNRAQKWPKGRNFDVLPPNFVLSSNFPLLWDKPPGFGACGDGAIKTAQSGNSEFRGPSGFLMTDSKSPHQNLYPTHFPDPRGHYGVF